MISVVVPVYNAEQYLKDSIESVLNQCTVQLELILIDDGSTDRSLEICNKYAAKDDRVVVYSKENTGVSNTRNIGIELAKGEYILFLDADDYLDKNAISTISSALQRDSADVLSFGYRTVGGTNCSNDMELLKNNSEGFSSKDLLRHLISTNYRLRFRGFVWRCAFKRTFLNEKKIRFIPELRMCEDYKFLLDVITNTDRIAVVAEPLYVYRINNSSVTSRYKENVHRDMAWVNLWMGKHICRNNPELFSGWQCCCAETYICAIQNLCSTGTPFSVYDRIINAWKIKKEYNYLQMIKVARSEKTNSYKRRMIYWLLSLHMEPLYIFLYSIKKRTLNFSTIT